jgi:ADP-ribosylglycohydrolase
MGPVRRISIAGTYRIIVPVKRTDPSVSGPAPPTPIPNSYWVEPGRLLAGEYPGSMSRAEALSRIQSLLRAGVNSFIDLTESGEMPPYDSLLPHESRAAVTHDRHAITDHGVPASPQAMSGVLDAITERLAAGRCVYVHCRAGIGRTGMTVACHLVRSGLANDAALDRLQELWQECARSHSWPSVPETEAQVAFVRNWREPAPSRPAQRKAVAAGPASFAERCEGALVGMAIGEALGILEAGGSLKQLRLTAPNALFTGADTAMTRCVAESLLSRGGHSAEDHMRRYSDYIRTGQQLETGAAAMNLSPELKRAVATWQWSRKAEAGTHDPKNLDPHSLARTLAVALYRRADPAAAIEVAAQVSRTTQQSPVVLDTVRVWVAVLIDALAGLDKAQFLDLRQGPSMRIVRQRNLRKELDRLLDGRWSALAPDENGAVGVAARALLAVQESENFEQGVQGLLGSSAQLGSPALTAASAGALYGSLAGAHYGIGAIPESWRQALRQLQPLRELAAKFAGS